MATASLGIRGSDCPLITASQCFRAVTLVSRNGMKSAGANVNFVVLFFIGRVSADPGARRGKVIIPEHEVGIGSGLDQTLAVESEEARGVERSEEHTSE